MCFVTCANYYKASNVLSCLLSVEMKVIDYDWQLFSVIIELFRNITTEIETQITLNLCKQDVTLFMH